MDATERGLWLRWLPTFFAYIAGGVLAMTTVGHIDSLGAALVGGALAGAAIGTGQWLVLRKRLERAWWWIVATAVGEATGLAIGSALVDYGTAPGQLAVQGALTGLAIGLLQAQILRRNGAEWRLWAPALSLIWALGWLVTWAIGVDVESQYTNFGAAGAITATALSGLLLVRALRTASTHSAMLPLVGADVASS
jgi:hypothetical protein